MHLGEKAMIFWSVGCQTERNVNTLFINIECISYTLRCINDWACNHLFTFYIQEHEALIIKKDNK